MNGFASMRAFLARLQLRLIACAVLLFLFSCAVKSVAQEADEKASAPARRLGSIRGQVIDNSGQPIFHALVYAQRVGNSMNASAPSAETDASGQFKFSRLPVGAYTLNAAYPGYVRFASSEDALATRTYYHLGDSATITLIKGGIVTGRITNSNGEPMVNTTIKIQRVRDTEGRPAKSSGWYNPWMFATDDRGIYRIYGLEPGAYLVSVGGGDDIYSRNPLYNDDTPTFYPSSLREGAQEVMVREGQEVSGIDIRHRGEQGHSLSGVVTGAVTGGSQWQSISINLKGAKTGNDIAYVFAPMAENEKGSKFEMNGVADGEYELIASRSGFGLQDVFASVPTHISVKGADVNGIELRITPLASISGHLILEPLARPAGAAGSQDSCAPGRMPEPSETVITTRLSERSAVVKPLSQIHSFAETVSNPQGNFTLGNLGGGRYRLRLTPPGEAWYIRTLTAGTSNRNVTTTAAGANQKLTSDEIILRAGESARDVNITIAEGAAGVRGKVGTGTALPPGMFVYLVPADPAQADEVFRYAEVSAEADGTFNLSNIAPGKYWLLARARAGKEETNENTLPLFWDAASRAKLRHDAEAAKKEVELKPCQRLSDQILLY